MIKINSGNQHRLGRNTNAYDPYVFSGDIGLDNKTQIQYILNDEKTLFPTIDLIVVISARKAKKS